MSRHRLRPALRNWMRSRAKPGPAPFVGAYDAIPSIAALYAMRRALSSWTGALIRLRRSTDNAEQDFGYVANGDLDTGAIASWLGVASGYITTWYEQSGSGYHATQATAANQPLYVASGQNGKPVARLVGNFLRSSSFSFDLRNRTIFFVAQENVGITSAGILSFVSPGANDWNASNALSINTGGSGSLRPVVQAATYGVGGPVVVGAMPIAIYCERKSLGGTGRFYRAGGTPSATDSSYTEVTNATGGILIGSRWLSGAELATYRINGDVAEIVCCDSELPAGSSNQIGQNLSDYFDLSWSNI